MIAGKNDDPCPTPCERCGRITPRSSTLAYCPACEAIVRSRSVAHGSAYRRAAPNHLDQDRR